MKVMLYPFEDVDIWCFAKEDRLAKIEAYLKCHDPNLHYAGVFDRMEKVNICFKKMSIIIFCFCADRMR